MTIEQAQRVHPGDVVEYRGERRLVMSVQVRGIAAPHFRLDGVGLVSYRLVQPVAPDYQAFLDRLEQARTIDDLLH